MLSRRGEVAKKDRAWWPTKHVAKVVWGKVVSNLVRLDCGPPPAPGLVHFLLDIDHWKVKSLIIYIILVLALSPASFVCARVCGWVGLCALV